MVDIYNQFKDFKAFEIEFEDESGTQKKLFCSVRSIENDSLVIDADIKKNKGVVASVGTPLRLYIYTDTGIYSATSSVLKVESGLVNVEYVIAYPTDSKHSQRREYFRADMSVKFKADFKPKDEFAETFSIEGKTRNICGKGMSCVVNKIIPECSSINVTLYFDDKKITTNASLVYSTQIISGNNPKFIHAFAFTSISQKEIDFIVKKCFLHQLELRKQQLL